MDERVLGGESMLTPPPSAVNAQIVRIVFTWCVSSEPFPIVSRRAGRRRVVLHIGVPQVHRLRFGAHPEVDHLDEYREPHGEINVPLRNVLHEALEEERHADQQQEAERKHLHRRVLVYERADWFGGHHHDADRGEAMTAVIMTHSSSTMPTAVMTESSENTISSSMIWTITRRNDAATQLEACPSSPSSPSCISNVLFASRNKPPPMRIRSRPETG